MIRETLAGIIAGLGEVALELPIVLPLHPRTLGRMEQFGLRDSFPSEILICDPLGYLGYSFALEEAAALILTDSGGMQKEAFFQRTPCVTIRSETEWVELLDGGHNRLGSSRSRFNSGESS